MLSTSEDRLVEDFPQTTYLQEPLCHISSINASDDIDRLIQPLQASSLGPNMRSMLSFLDQKDITHEGLPEVQPLDIDCLLCLEMGEALKMSIKETLVLASTLSTAKPIQGLFSPPMLLTYPPESFDIDIDHVLNLPTSQKLKHSMELIDYESTFDEENCPSMDIDDILQLPKIIVADNGSTFTTSIGHFWSLLLNRLKQNQPPKHPFNRFLYSIKNGEEGPKMDAEGDFYPIENEGKEKSQELNDQVNEVGVENPPASEAVSPVGVEKKSKLRYRHTVAHHTFRRRSPEDGPTPLSARSISSMDLNHLGNYSVSNDINELISIGSAGGSQPPQQTDGALTPPPQTQHEDTPHLLPSNVLQEGDMTAQSPLLVTESSKEGHGFDFLSPKSLKRRFRSLRNLRGHPLSFMSRDVSHSDGSLRGDKGRKSKEKKGDEGGNIKDIDQVIKVGDSLSALETSA